MKRGHYRMGERRKRLCSILSAFMLCIALALVFRLALPAEPVQEAPQGAGTPCLVYLDPGHGGFDAGAVGQLADGGELLEKDLVLAVAGEVAEGLSSMHGYAVLLSRTGEERLTYGTAGDEVRARRAAAAEAGAALIVSVHANSYAGEGRAYGARVYYNPASEPSRRAAESIAAAITQGTAAAGGRACQVVPDGTYYILADPSLPAVLVELGFLSDSEELARLATPAYRHALATAICEGVAAWE